MEGLILNRNFQTEAVLDGFESFIWTERYCEPGDFEIYIPIKLAPMEYVIRGNYIWIRDSDRLMIIEDIEIATDAEVGPHVTITGRSLESLLESRIISDQVPLNNNIQYAIYLILNTYFISPTDSDRRLPLLQFKHNTDSRLQALQVSGNYFGYTALEFIEDVCTLYEVGFRIRYDETDEKPFVFEVYFGEDRSYDQEENSWVVFSPNYDNLLNSNYYETSRTLCTVAIVAGDSNNSYGQEIITVNGKPGRIGIERREMFVDASDIELPSDEVDEEAIRSQLSAIPNITEAYIQNAIANAKKEEYLKNLPKYIMQLEQRGYEELAKTYVTESFDGEIEATRQYVYERDFFIGDVVQIRDEYGKEASSRITEVVRAHDRSGEKLMPTFTTLLKDEEE